MTKSHDTGRFPHRVQHDYILPPDSQQGIRPASTDEQAHAVDTLGPPATSTDAENPNHFHPNLS